MRQRPAAMRRECVTDRGSGKYTVKGGGWFWVDIQRSERGLDITQQAPGMETKKAARLFKQEAKLTIEKHFPQ